MRFSFELEISIEDDSICAPSCMCGRSRGKCVVNFVYISQANKKKVGKTNRRKMSVGNF